MLELSFQQTSIDNQKKRRVYDVKNYVQPILSYWPAGGHCCDGYEHNRTPPLSFQMNLNERNIN
jgi:hypothetical protein